MNTLSLQEISERLNYTDLRAARKWCNENAVLLIKQGKNEFAFETNFKEAFELPFINKLKKEFGERWSEVYQLYIEGNVPALNKLHEVPSVTHKTYKSQSNSRSIFLKNCEKYVKGKAA